MMTYDQLNYLEEEIKRGETLSTLTILELINTLREFKDRDINLSSPLSRRDWFAGMAMQGYNLNKNSLFASSLNMIKACIAEADAMLAELDKEEK